MTILLDSFRLLHAKKLFWVTFAITILVALTYASIGYTDNGVSLFFGLKEFGNDFLIKGSDEAAAFHLLLFTDVIVKFWLAWFAIMLALISTASIFPDFLQEGSIGISLSKPIGRIQLFLWKYFGGLLFVFLQILIFTLIVFLAIGWRIGEWNFTVFWAVPLVTFVFSIIYSVCVMIGVWSKSTLLALLGGFLVWGLTLAAQYGERITYEIAYVNVLVEVEFDPETSKETHNKSLVPNEDMVGAHNIAKKIAYPLPKTRDCTGYLKRLIKFDQRDSMLSGVSFETLFSGEMDDSTSEVNDAIIKMQERHSAFYVFGSSLLFEFSTILLAGWLFSRKDY